MRRHPVTVFYAVPTFYAAFLASHSAPQKSELKLRCCVSAGEALPADVGKRWVERYGVDILDGIGSTEMLHIFLSNKAGEVKYGTTGKPVPGYDCKLIDDNGLPVDKGEMGELLIKGPTSAIMYWNNRAKSRSTFVGEWTRSGDKYSQDADGFYAYGGRTDDMLIVRGVNLFPSQVEEQILRDPALSGHYVIELSRVAALDDLLVRVESRETLPADAVLRSRDALARRLKGMCGLSAEIEIASPGRHSSLHTSHFVCSASATESPGFTLAESDAGKGISTEPYP